VGWTDVRDAGLVSHDGMCTAGNAVRVLHVSARAHAVASVHKVEPWEGTCMLILL
jgi:hypothetical protein